MVSGIADVAITVDSVDALNAAPMGGKTVAEIVTDKIATIGENMSVRRMQSITGDTVVSYVHNAAAPGMGKIGVLVAMTGGDDAFGKQVAMHIAAVNPASLSEDDLDASVVEKENRFRWTLPAKAASPKRLSKR